MMPLDIREVAINAKNYAREHILKGCTQIENNALPETNKFALISAVLDVRDLQERASSLTAETYERTIAFLKKYSLGNCSEMALMGLDYVVTHHPQVYAQVYCIENGDHEFLVIGSKKPSLSTLDNWDQEAYICDPWANTFYPVSAWRKKLNNFEYVKAGQIAEETRQFQKNKFKFFANKKLSVGKKNNRHTLVTPIYNKTGTYIGNTYFFDIKWTNTVTPLNDRHFARPLSDHSDSISLYDNGATYRRAKIKSVLMLLRPFSDIFSEQTKCLNQLLEERPLLWDASLNESLLPTELLRREELLKQSIYSLQNFAKYLNDLQGEPDLQKRCAFPIPIQLQAIHNAIDALEQLLERRVLQDIDILIPPATIDKQFSTSTKNILNAYPCPSSKKFVVEKAIAKVEEDIDSFLAYFYETLKPTLQTRRNPILDRSIALVMAFFSLKYPVDRPTNGTQVASKLEKLIKSNLTPLRPAVSI